MVLWLNASTARQSARTRYCHHVMCRRRSDVGGWTGCRINVGRRQRKSQKPTFTASGNLGSPKFRYLQNSSSWPLRFLGASHCYPVNKLTIALRAPAGFLIEYRPASRDLHTSRATNTGRFLLAFPRSRAFAVNNFVRTLHSSSAFFYLFFPLHSSHIAATMSAEKPLPFVYQFAAGE